MKCYLRTRRCPKRGMAYWMVWISRLASGLMRWLVPISSPANTHFSTSHRSVLDADRIKDALILGFGWYGDISNVDTPHNAISYFSNMNDHLLINWLTGQDKGTILTADQKYTALIDNCVKLIPVEPKNHVVVKFCFSHARFYQLRKDDLTLDYSKEHLIEEIFDPEYERLKSDNELS